MGAWETGLSRNPSKAPFFIGKMAITRVNELSTTQTRVKLVTSLDTSPATYYGVASNDVEGTSWRGGEMVYHTGDNRFYIQVATSGTTATWKRLLEQTISA